MIEIFPSLFIGSEADEQAVHSEPDWRFVHACKEPYHRRALGYSGRAAPKNHPEYLLARRPERLILNLVDVEDPAYIAVEIMDAALEFIDESLVAERKTLVHCNQGESRGPSIGLLYIASRTNRLPRTSLADAEAAYRELYPAYNPKAGIRGFLQIHWTEYMTRQVT